MSLSIPLGRVRHRPAAINYVISNAYRDLTIDQTVAAINFHGKGFALWSDPVGYAFGAEYRKLSMDQTTDTCGTDIINLTGIRGAPPSLQGKTGRCIVGNFTPISGSFDVKEAYAEVNVPILKDMQLAKSLELNSAVRYTDYSTSGGVTTWKVGGVYAPLQDLRFRATRSRDIRAPNVTELFTTRAQTFLGQVTNPTTNQIIPAVGFSAGNLQLAPETADTVTAGVVFSPRMLPGFQASIDFFQHQDPRRGQRV